MAFWKKKKDENQNEEKRDQKEHSAEDHKIEFVPGAAAQAKEPNVEEMKRAQEKAAVHISQEKPSLLDMKKFSLFKAKPTQAKTSFISEAKRVLLVAKKPSGEEYKASFKITGLGILIIGTIGMAIYLLFTGVLGI